MFKFEFIMQFIRGNYNDLLFINKVFLIICRYNSYYLLSNYIIFEVILEY